MLYIRIELWPGGDQRAARTLGEATIANDASGSQEIGNYAIKLMKSPEYASSTGVWRQGRIERFPRKRLGPWDLLFQGLRACLGGRNAVPSNRKPPPDPNRKISDAQARRYYAIARNSPRMEEEIREYLSAACGVEKPNDLLASQYEAAVAWLRGTQPGSPA